MKKAVLSLLLAAVFMLTAGCGLKNRPAQEDEPQGAAETEQIDKEDDEMNKKIFAAIEVEGFGTIQLELYPDIAPETVRNFCYLARQGFYDGTTFHRIIQGFMIQGGDPTGTGSGGPGYVIKGEFVQNGFDNPLLHTRGVISMARLSKPYDSAGCQFFIVQQDSPHLNGGYAAFGQVISGMEVVDAIAAVATGANNRPVEPVVISSITITGPELPEPQKLPDLH